MIQKIFYINVNKFLGIYDSGLPSKHPDEARDKKKHQRKGVTKYKDSKKINVWVVSYFLLKNIVISRGV